MFVRNLYKKYFVEDKLFRNTLVVLLITLGVVFVYSDISQLLASLVA